jgi:hypothetical protein
VHEAARGAWHAEDVRGPDVLTSEPLADVDAADPRRGGPWHPPMARPLIDQSVATVMYGPRNARVWP